MGLGDLLKNKKPNKPYGPEAATPQGSNSSQNAVMPEPPIAAQLENALVDNARHDTPETRTRVYQELLFSQLLLALVDSDNPPQDTPQVEQTVNVAILANPQGVQFAAVFTSPAAAKRWRAEGGQYAAIRGQDIFKLLEQSPADVIVLNASSAPFAVLSKAEYRSLAQGIVPQSPRSPVQVAQATEQTPSMQIAFPPDAFTEEQKSQLRDFFVNCSLAVEAVALGAISAPSDGEPKWLKAVFLRLKSLPQQQEDIQKICIDTREEILRAYPVFQNEVLEVGVMPDMSFWDMANENNLVIFHQTH